MAVKIIKNKPQLTKQGKVEVRLLNYIKNKDEKNVSNIVVIKEHFMFRNHLCIIFELLSLNLYEYLKERNFRVLDMLTIKNYSLQILKSLCFLFRHKILHCDIKLENILFSLTEKNKLKLIDLGSSCFEFEKIYSYIQSRFYRSPEIVLGYPYSNTIDMWSFGCILVELYTGFHQ